MDCACSTEMKGNERPEMKGTTCRSMDIMKMNFSEREVGDWLRIGSAGSFREVCAVGDLCQLRRRGLLHRVS
jgi:diaminopimelate decarboxylase